MSSEDPSDDELEHEQMHPAMAGRTRHAPKLDGESRAISLPKMREEAELPSETRQRAQAEADGELLQAQTKKQLPPKPPPQLRLLAPAPDGLRPATARPNTDAEVWDRYVVAALPLVVGIAPTTDGASALAGQFADLLLAERRRRFG